MIIVILSQLIVLTLLILMLYYIFKPTPVQSFMKKILIPVTNFELDTTQHTMNTHTHEKHNRSLNVYHLVTNGIDVNSRARTLLIWFHGGCFVIEDPANVMPFMGLIKRKAPDNLDILIFDYPLPFDVTIDDTLIYIHDMLLSFFEDWSETYDSVFIGGDSAGSFLGLKTLEIENSESFRGALGIANPIGMHIGGFIGICGFYDVTFHNNTIASFCFQSYVMRGVSNKTKYQQMHLLHRMLLMTSKNDFLLSQTRNFFEKNRQRGELVVYDTPNTFHGFIGNTTLAETHNAVDKILLFIK